jgi:O-antigen ligase
LFLKEEDFGGRLGLEFGSISNPNDFACHLLLTLPFLLWVARGTRSIVVRTLALAGVGLGVFTILRTGSRGALIALVLASLFVLLRGTAPQRIVLLGSAVVLIPVLLVALPKETLQRITSFSASDTSASAEALGSSEMREYLLRKSVEYAFHNPIFGVGAGQFAWAEGILDQVGGTTHGYWHETHNTYTQVASECGFPAFFLFIGGTLSAFLLLNSTWRQARQRPDCKDIAAASFFAMLAMVAFCTAIFFLSFAYYFYLPALAGLAIALDRTARAEFVSRAALVVEPQQPPWAAPPSGFQTGARRIPPGLAQTARQAAS